MTLPEHPWPCDGAAHNAWIAAALNAGMHPVDQFDATYLFVYAAWLRDVFPMLADEIDQHAAACIRAAGEDLGMFAAADQLGIRCGLAPDRARALFLQFFEAIHDRPDGTTASGADPDPKPAAPDARSNPERN